MSPACCIAVLAKRISSHSIPSLTKLKIYGAVNKEVRKDFLHDFRLLCAVSAPFHLLSVTL